MLRTWSLALLVMLLAPVMTAQAQNTGKLKGTITDAETGEPLPGANVVIEGTQLGAASGAEGDYTILGVPVGTYDVRASFVGYQAVTVNDVEINSGYTRQLDFDLQPGQQLEEVEVTYEQPLIQNDAIGAPRVTSSEDIENLPVRGAADVAALQGGVVDIGGEGDLFVRGGRDQEITYYVDGVKVLGGQDNLGVPQSAVQEQEMLIGTIPVRYGDAMSGVVSISTKSGGDEFFGTIEGISSEVLDPYSYNLGSISVGGPILGNKLGFFLSGKVEHTDDATPYGGELPSVSDEMFNSLQQNPQSVQVVNRNGELEYRKLPSSDLENVEFNDTDAFAEELRGMTVQGDTVLGAGESLSGNGLFNRAATLTREDFQFQSEKRDPQADYNILGNINFAPTEAINVRLGGSYILQENQSWDYSRSLYNDNRYYNREEQIWRVYGTWRQRLSDVTFYQLQAEYTDERHWNYPNGFGRDIEDALFYGDVDHPVNDTYSNYWVTNTNTGVLERSQDGTTSPGSVYGMFNLPGEGTGDYDKSHDQQLRFSGNATTQIGLNQLEFGAEYEQRTRRFIDLDAANLAGFYNDVDGAELGQAEAVDSYEELTYRQMRSSSTYYGYNVLGTEEADEQDVQAFSDALTQTGQFEDADGLDDVPDDVFNIAPHEPIYYAGYVRDKIEYKDLVLDIGARVDVFDNNTKVLRDIYATVPVKRVSDLGDPSSAPSAVESDAVVYYDNAGDPVGYRESNTANFFDAQGNTAEFTDINNLGTPQVAEDENGETLPSFHPRKFEDYEPEVTFMPRVGVSFPVTNQSLFFASYNVTSQRPSENAFEPFNSYRELSGQDELNNPRLEPEITTQYELGLRQRVSETAALQISGFYRTQRNKIRVVELTEAFPTSYSTFVNEDFTTTKGLELTLDLRRTNNFAADANYTLQFAQGTGSDSNTLAVVRWLNPGGEPNFISPLSFDRRHTLNASLDYRLGEGEGPEVFGAHALANFGVNLLAVAKSGLPYSQVRSTKIITDPQPPKVKGDLGDVTTPWTSRLDLKVDRRFNLGGLSAQAYVWVQNLLDSRNPISVYRATGVGNNDGFLSTPGGRDQIQSARPSSESFEDHYQQYQSGPTNVTSYNMSRPSDSRIYSLPRRTRLGFLINF
jgi:outer membrane receptor protein involved in Fe transport